MLSLIFFNFNIYKFLLIYTEIIEYLIHYLKNLVNALQSISFLSPKNVNLNLNVWVNVPVKVTVEKWINNITNFIKTSGLLSDLIKKNYIKNFESKTRLNLKLLNYKILILFAFENHLINYMRHPNIQDCNSFTMLDVVVCSTMIS